LGWQHSIELKDGIQQVYREKFLLSSEVKSWFNKPLVAWKKYKLDF
jgi:hypothetical protein